ncbi:unnamed protein product, partial [Musa acuminata var. zebrina]
QKSGIPKDASQPLYERRQFLLLHQIGPLIMLSFTEVHHNPRPREDKTRLQTRDFQRTDR